MNMKSEQFKPPNWNRVEEAGHYANVQTDHVLCIGHEDQSQCYGLDLKWPQNSHVCARWLDHGPGTLLPVQGDWITGWGALYSSVHWLINGLSSWMCCQELGPDRRWDLEGCPSLLPSFSALATEYWAPFRELSLSASYGCLGDSQTRIETVSRNKPALL